MKSRARAGDLAAIRSVSALVRTTNGSARVEALDFLKELGKQGSQRQRDVVKELVSHLRTRHGIETGIREASDSVDNAF